MATEDNRLSKELNKLKKSDLIEIILTKNVKESTNETVKAVFREIFSAKESEIDEKSVKNGTRCDKCFQEIRALKRDVDDLKRRLSDMKNSDDRSIKCDVNNGEIAGRGSKRKGQCQAADSNCGEMGIKTSASETATLEQIEQELKQFYEYCRENHLTDAEISKICQPLSSPLRRSKTKWFVKLLLGTFLALILLYCLTYFETISWHFLVIGRVLMVELLPIWNWKHLKNVECLVTGWNNVVLPPANRECTYCEFLDKIDVVDGSDAQDIYDRFIKLHRPALLEAGLKGWLTEPFNKSILTDVFSDEVISKSYTCKLSSNVHIGDGILNTVVKNVGVADIFFLHFQNCEFDAVKAFRKYFPRPDFLVPELAPVSYSWLLISNEYKVDKFKMVDLYDQVAIVGQLLGSNLFALRPTGCHEECKQLNVKLVPGEVLIISKMWDLDYIPDSNGENIAVILETH